MTEADNGKKQQQAAMRQGMRRRNIAVALALVALCVLIFVVSMVRTGNAG